MSKSVCIKSNNKQTISYIIDELEVLNTDDVYFSCRDFKNFTNVIVHYTGKNVPNFIASLSKILSYLVLDLYENSIIDNLISLDYFYFSEFEQKSIFDICINTLNYEDSLERFHSIENAFFEYLSNNKSINLKGFINFRLHDYFKYLDSIIDLCVNKFVVSKEYLDFINLLKAYIFSSTSTSDIVHLIYKDKNSVLLDENKNVIPINDNVFNVHYLSDISFSSNDYALNLLLTLIPKKLYIHLLGEKDDFINTLELIFDNRVHICHDCDICRLYSKTNFESKI